MKMSLDECLSLVPFPWHFFRIQEKLLFVSFGQLFYMCPTPLSLDSTMGFLSSVSMNVSYGLFAVPGRMDGIETQISG